jgi:hypothetical protein
MIGMALGMILARITMGLPLAIWFSFLSLTVFHMYGKLFCYGFRHRELFLTKEHTHLQGTIRKIIHGFMKENDLFISIFMLSLWPKN